MIWELRSLEWSRETINFKVLTDSLQELPNGSVAVPIEFETLEDNDGALIQMIYSGPSDVPIVLQGSIAGRPDTEEFPQTRHLVMSQLIYSGLSLIFGGLFLVVGVVEKVRTRPNALIWWLVDRGVWTPSWLTLGIFLLVAFVASLFLSDFYALGEIPRFDYVPPLQPPPAP